MDKLGDVLRRKQLPSEPPEVRAIISFIAKKYDESVRVTATEKHISITVPHAALAGALRFDLAELQIICQTTKKIYIRIG